MPVYVRWFPLAQMVALAACPAFAQPVTIAPDRMLLVDGKRTFVLGLYENPGDDAVLKQVADAGFNLVQATADKQVLDRLGQHGLHAWINTGSCIDLSEDRARREEQVRQLASSLGPHPALWAWEAPDEALWNCWYGPMQWRREQEPAQQKAKIDALPDKALAEELRAQRAEADRSFARGDYARFEQLADGIWRKLGIESPTPGQNVSQAAERAAKMAAGLREGHALLRQVDPGHPLWMNHAPRNQIPQLAAFNQAADILGCDIYPVPEYLGGHSDLADRSLASAGSYTTRMQDAAPGKPVWMVLQGFGWSDLEKEPSAESRTKNRRPTLDELRFMAYDTVAHGGRGILFWGTAYIEKDSDLWKNLMKLVQELAELQPVLSAADAPLNPVLEIAETWGSVDRGVRALPKAVDGKTWFIVVNEFSEPLRYTMGGLSALDGVEYADARDAREATVAGGRLTLDIVGHGVQVLQPRRR